MTDSGRGDGDWFADAEGNLSGPGEATPAGVPGRGAEAPHETDEFGRDDPAALERERRRREREQRRGGKRSKKAEKRAAKAEKPPRRAKPEKPPRRAKAERPPRRAKAEKRSRRAAKAEAPPRPAAQPEPPKQGRAAAGREALRARIERDRIAHPRTYRRRRFFALAMALAGILLVWFLVAFFQPFAGEGEGSGAVTVEIPEGASAGKIATILDDAGVVTSARLFEWRLRLAGKGDDIEADTYALASGMSYGAAIDRLTQPATGEITVSIPEGYDRTQIAELVLPEGVSSDDYLAQTEAAPPYFDPARYGAKTASLEGFLFPATYPLQAGPGAVPSLVKQQLQAFKDNFAKVDLSFAKKKNLTAYDVLIIASMINKEVQVPKEADDIAAVIYNRLSKGIPLGIDATTRFETQNYDEQITQAQLDADTPYNTRLNAGLTPTPIGNPGLAAIKAAANPAKVDYLFFVVKPGTCGEHSFTASEAEFERLAAEYQQALEAEGGSPTNCP